MSEEEKLLDDILTEDDILNLCDKLIYCSVSQNKEDKSCYCKICFNYIVDFCTEKNTGNIEFTANSKSELIKKVKDFLFSTDKEFWIV